MFNTCSAVATRIPVLRTRKPFLIAATVVANFIIYNIASFTFNIIDDNLIFDKKIE